jgi:hypothetical protein
MLPGFAAIFELDDRRQQKNEKCISPFVYKGKMHLGAQKTGKLQSIRFRGQLISGLAARPPASRASARAAEWSGGRLKAPERPRRA